MDLPVEGPRRASVRRCVEDLDGAKVGTYCRSPLMDAWEYELEYDYGTHDRYFANVIAENLYSQLDLERHQFLILEDISDHCSDQIAIYVAGGFIIIQWRNNHLKKNTSGWELLTQMKEGI